MKIAGSRIANSIDMEYRKKEMFFRNQVCKKCKNRNTNLCEIRQTIDHQYRCVYYEKEDI